MREMIGNNIGIIEMGLTALVMLIFLGWQYWTVRDAGKPKPPPEDISLIESEHFLEHRHKHD
jgi:hypothetical protein